MQLQGLSRASQRQGKVSKSQGWRGEVDKTSWRKKGSVVEWSFVVLSPPLPGPSDNKKR